MLIFSWFLSIFFSSFLKYCTFLLIAFLNSFGIFIIPFLNSVSIKLKRSVSLFVLSGTFSCSLIFGNIKDPSAFSFYWYFSCSEFRKNSYLLWSWRSVFMWGHPCVACVGLTFWVWGLFWCGWLPPLRVGWLSIPLTGGVAGVVVSRPCPGCGAGPSLCPVVVTTC